jgi:protein SCO1/2
VAPVVTLPRRSKRELIALHYIVYRGESLRLRIVLSALLLLSSFGCKSQKPATAERRFPIEGRVVAVNSAAHTLTLDHHEVVGYMKAMVMDYPVRDAWVFNVVHPGDTVQATLVVADDAHLENISVTQSRSAADLSSTSPVHLPQTGESVPDFHFVNQNARPIHLKQFRGEPLLVTFIYSRCPLPDYCIRMSNNFAEVAQILRKSNSAAFAKLQLLSISIDPEFDDPKILRSYGKSYAGAVDPNLEHWSLATGKPAEIRRAAEYFGLSYETQNGQVIHNLRTALLDADGKIAGFYSGNQWKPSEVAAQIQALQR